MKYKIIIPKEEAKQGTMSEAIKQVITDKLKQETLEESKKQQFRYDNLHDAKEISSKIKVVETLEEVAERLYSDKLYPMYGSIRRDAFTNGAKWQQERSYSEEDMKQSYNAGVNNEHKFQGHYTQKTSFKKWFEHYKKKS